MDLFSTCLYCDLPVNPNTGLHCEACYAEEYGFLEDSFIGDILNLLPQNWVREFSAVQALEVFTLDDYIDMTYNLMSKENIQSIAKLCIINSHLDYPGDSPYEILNMLRFKGAKFNGEMYELARSNECIDSERILNLFCDLPVTRIQRAWLRHRQWRRNRAVQIILPKVQEWLYRPGGLMMKKFEKHFNELATTQY